MQTRLGHAAERKVFEVATERVIQSASGPDRELAIGHFVFDPTSACNKHCLGCWAAD